MTEPYQNLVNAIILRAIKDYRGALKKLKKRPKYGPAQYMKNEVERFFRSDWYRELTSVDGEILIKKLQAEVSEQWKLEAAKPREKRMDIPEIEAAARKHGLTYGQFTARMRMEGAYESNRD